MRRIGRLCLAAAAVAASWALPTLTSPAAASSPHAKPTITTTQASFAVPAGPAQAWLVRLWTLPKPSTLVGQAFGSAGTLTLDVPLTKTCEFQVDVKVAPAGTTNPNDFTWYSGVVATV